MATTVVNIKRTRQYDQYIGRAGCGQDGYFGNPFPLRAGQPKGSTLEKFRAYFYDRLATDNEFRNRVLALKGKTLGCFCSSLPCHGHIIAEWIDKQPSS